MNEAKLIRGAKRILPVLEMLLGYTEAGDENATIVFGRNTVSPVYRRAFGSIPMYGKTQLVDTRNPTDDRPASLPMLAEHTKNYCISAFTTSGIPGEDKAAYETGVNGARSFIERMKNIVSTCEVAQT